MQFITEEEGHRKGPMMPAKVSVLIPSYNHGRFLSATLRSVLSQSMDDIEVFLVDDGSTDDSYEIALEFSGQDKRLKVFHQKNQGTIRTLNRLYELSTAPVICQIGSDDVWHKEFVADSLLDLEKHPDASATFCRFEVIDQNDIHKHTPEFPFASELSGAPLLEYLVVQNCLAAFTACIRRRSVAENLPFARDLRGVEDWDLWVRLSKNGSVRVRDFVGGKYRVHGANQSLQQGKEVLKNHMKVLDDHAAEIFSKYRLSRNCLERLFSRRILLTTEMKETEACILWLRKKNRRFGLTLQEGIILANSFTQLQMWREAEELVPVLEAARKNTFGSTSSVVSVAQDS